MVCMSVHECACVGVHAVLVYQVKSKCASVLQLMCIYVCIAKHMWLSGCACGCQLVHTQTTHHSQSSRYERYKCGGRQGALSSSAVCCGRMEVMHGGICKN